MGKRPTEIDPGGEGRLLDDRKKGGKCSAEGEKEVYGAVLGNQTRKFRGRKGRDRKTFLNSHRKKTPKSLSFCTKKGAIQCLFGGHASRGGGGKGQPAKDVCREGKELSQLDTKNVLRLEGRGQQGQYGEEEGGGGEGCACMEGGRQSL